MTILEAILLGLVQGLSEFLPISSTAHVTLVGKLLGLVDPARPEEWTAFLAVVQLGTLVAVLAYFRVDILSMARAFLQAGASRIARRPVDPTLVGYERLAWLVVLGTLPIAVVGLAVRDLIEGPLTKDLRVIAASLIGLAVLLALAERVGARTRTMESLTWRDALVVGFAQVIALVPGASRSGTTLTGGLFAGLERATAARFSFLLAIPAIGASGLLELPVALGAASLPVGPLLAATMLSAVSGYAAIWFMLRFLERNSTRVFIVYRIALGLVLVALLWTGVVSAR